MNLFDWDYGEPMSIGDANQFFKVLHDFKRHPEIQASLSLVKKQLLYIIFFVLTNIFHQKCEAQPTEEKKDSVFGKFIPLKPDAVQIMSEFDNVNAESKDIIVKELKRLRKDSSAKYYNNDIKAFVFNLDTLKNYLDSAKKNGKADYVLIIKASDGHMPTSVLAAAKRVRPDSTNFRIVPSTSQEVLEHPGRKANILLNQFEKSGPIIIQVE